MPPPRIPNELVGTVLAEVSDVDKFTLATLSLVSSSFRKIVHPRLYRHISFSVSTNTRRLSRSSSLLFDMLRQPNHHLRKWVHSVTIEGQPGGGQETSDDPFDLVEFGREIIKVFGDYANYHFVHTPRIGEFDLLLATRQSERRAKKMYSRLRNPPAHLVAAASEIHYDYLMGAYSSFTCTSDDFGKDPELVLEKLLSQSTTKLESLEIPLTRSVSLRALEELNSLKVRFVPDRFIDDLDDPAGGKGGLGVAQNLVSILSDLPVQHLILAGRPVADEKRWLFNLINAPFRLHDAVVSLSLEFPLYPRYILEFVRRLSVDSELRELNVWTIMGSDKEDVGDAIVQELQLECKRRRIALVYGQTWDL
ncbi:hypothetical protein JCM11491_006593 [Sporobolomyces phaffii]